MAIDWDFLQRVEGKENTTYIPMKKGKVIQNSGVTVGTGVDLGQQTAAKFRKLGISEEIIEKLKPFFNKTQDKAVAALNKNGEVTLDDDEIFAIDEALKKDTLKSVKSWYNKDNTLDQDWGDLSDNQQTVVLSVFYNHGLDGAPNFKKQIETGDWSGAIGNLRSFYKTKDNDLHKRRVKEAQYLAGLRGEEIDGIDGPDTEAAVKNYIDLAQRDRASIMFNEQPMPEPAPNPNTGAMVPQQTSVEQGALESTVNPVAAQESSDEFLNRLYEGLGKALNRQQSAPQEPTEAVTEPQEEESEPESEYGAGEQAFFDRISSSRPGQDTGEEAEESSEEEAPDPRYEGFGDGERRMLEALRARGTTETKAPVRARLDREEIREDRDPTYGIF